MDSKLLALVVVAVAGQVGCGGGVERIRAYPTGPRATLRVPLSFEPGRLLTDAARHRIVVADQTHSRLMVYTADGLAPFATLPDAGSGPLGQMALLDDGSVVVARRGGAVFVVSTSGDVRPLGNLDSSRRYIGLTAAGGNGVLASFMGPDGSAGVAALGLDGSEEVRAATPPVPGDLTSSDGQLFMLDADGRALLAAAAEALADLAPIASLEDDQLVALASGAGAVYAAARSGRVYRIVPAQAPVVVVDTGRPLSGVAVDELGARLVVAAPASDGRPPELRIVPVL